MNLFKSENYKRYIIFALAVLIIIFRQPSLFIKARFWAEEGAVYFSFAYSHNWITSLFTPHLGYYSLFNNIVTSIAYNLFPLRYAPYITTYFAFFIQLIPICIVIWTDLKYWNTFIKKICVVMIVIFTSATGEVWLNTINSQFHLSLITFFILLDTSKISRIKSIIYNFMLVLAGLTGVVSCFLTPIFFIKYYYYRQKENLKQLIILSACSIIQFFVFIRFMLNGGFGNRFGEFHLDKFLNNFIVQGFLLPVLGLNTYDLNIIPLYKNVKYLILTFVLVMLVIFLFSLKISNFERFSFIGGLSLLINLSLLSSLWMLGGPRYVYASGVIFIIFVFSNIDFNRNILSQSLTSKLSLIIVLMSLIINISQFDKQMNNFYSESWPTTKEELLKWEADNNYKIKIWPQWGEDNDWYMDLNRIE